MAITHIIAHKIQRLTPTTAATLALREDELNSDGKVEECARELKISFIKKLGKIHGRFSSDSAEHPLSAWLREQREEKMSFAAFSKRAMEHFKLELDKGEALIDGVVFFIEERFENSHELYFLVTDHSAGQYLDGKLNIADSIYLDTGNITLGAKINLGEWLGDNQHLNYLSVLPWRGEKDLSDAFIAYTGFTDKADIKGDTEVFLEAVDSYTAQLPEDLAHETRARVVNYCLEQDKAGNRVVINDLSSQVNEGNQQEFAKHLKVNQPQLKSELIPDRVQLRQYIRISGRDDLLSMSFDSKCLGESIVYNSDSDSLTITKIPSALKTRLLKHLKKDE